MIHVIALNSGNEEKCHPIYNLTFHINMVILLHDFFFFEWLHSLKKSEQYRRMILKISKRKGKKKKETKQQKPQKAQESTTA